MFGITQRALKNGTVGFIFLRLCQNISFYFQLLQSYGGANSQSDAQPYNAPQDNSIKASVSVIGFNQLNTNLNTSGSFGWAWASASVSLIKPVSSATTVGEAFQPRMLMAIQL